MKESPEGGEPRKGLGAWWLLIGAGAVLLFYFLVDPLQFSPIPPCPMYRMSGYLCPGCGGQRALHALLRGDLAASWALNPLVILAGPLAAAALVFREIVRYRRGPGAPAPGLQAWQVWVGAGALALFTLVRNLS